MANKSITVPDSTAVRVALWRAMHVQIDSPPHVLEDEIGLKLIAPDEDWKNRQDMHPEGTKGYRASIIGRARFIEDLVLNQMAHGLNQYVILGAGVDTFVQRRPDIATKLNVFEIDQPATQAWKRQRLIDQGYGIAKNLKFVPVDFEAGESWQEKLIASGFDAKKPAVIASAGVSMYLTRAATKASLAQIATFAPGSTLIMTFILPLNLIDPEERAQHEFVYERAKAAGTPFISFYSPHEMVALALEAGFKLAKHVSRANIIQRYFSGRADGLQPSSGEEYLVAST